MGPYRYSLNDTIRWYDELSAANADAPNFARLFVVPGMGYCNGAIATDKIDLLTALEDWLEEGIPPDVVVAGVAAGNPDILADWSASRTRIVTVDDIIALANVAPGTAQPSACPHGLPVGGDVNVAVIIQAVNDALNGRGG
jgi:hypothetical protein